MHARTTTLVTSATASTQLHFPIGEHALAWRRENPNEDQDLELSIGVLCELYQLIAFVGTGDGGPRNAAALRQSAFVLRLQHRLEDRETSQVHKQVEVRCAETPAESK
jgi:hypothetical protein